MSDTVRENTYLPATRSSHAAVGRGAGLYPVQFRLANDRLFFTDVEVKPGDPEFINFVLSLDGSLMGVLTSLAHRELPDVRLASAFVVSVVGAPPRYPASVSSGDVIARCPVERGVFLANTTRVPSGLMTGESRALVASGTGASLQKARATAYAIIERYETQLRYRRDIGCVGDKPLSGRLAASGAPARYPVQRTRVRDRVARSKARLTQRGGAVRNIRLTPEANQALLAMAAKRGDRASLSAILNDLVIGAAKKAKLARLA